MSAPPEARIRRKPASSLEYSGERAAFRRIRPGDAIIAGNIPGPGLIISAGVIALTWVVLGMRVRIDVVAGHVVIRCRPFYTSKIRLSGILAASKTSETTLADGYGARAVGANTRGALAGGRAVALETKTRKWIVSAEHPEAVASRINEQIARN
ncbi:hypothetical protein [Arthrobacter sp. UYCu712]|uniref:hypothetical protein n=1 Tax=Arthrobacter sp. UYCu712 TaxID=3156340 RepID=UPI003394A250